MIKSRRSDEHSVIRQGWRVLMIPFHRCPVCGGEVVPKQTEKLLRGGVNFAAVTVSAEVCLRCGEHLYSPETIRLFEQIRHKLTNQDVEEFEPLGRAFQVPGC